MMFMGFLKRRPVRRRWSRPELRAVSAEPILLEEYESDRQAVDARHDKGLLTAPPSTYDLADWDGDLSSRRIRLRANELVVEMFGTPATTKRLHVFLSAGGGALKSGATPQFPRASWHPWMEGTSVNIDDPTFASFPGRLQTGWYLGTRGQDGVATLANIIGTIQSRYGITNNDVYLIGSSAGGTAALKLALAVPGATAIAENPPLYPPESSSNRYLRRVGIKLDEEPFRSRNDLRPLLTHEVSRFFILQNAQDKECLTQLNRLLAHARMPSLSEGLNEFGPLNVYLSNVPSVSPHHAFLSVHEFRSVLGVINGKSPFEGRSAVLDAVHEGLRSRILASDQISNIKGWIRLWSELEVPLLADLPTPGTADIVRIPLRENRSVVYRIRLGHQAKKVFFAVNLKTSSTVAKAAIDRVATEIGAKVSNEDDGTRIGISGVPIARAAERLKEFVDATAPLTNENFDR